MALIVETGAVVTGADSYISLVDARALADQYGWTLPTDDTEAEQALRNGAKYVDMQENRYGGTRVSADQSLSWPRSGAYNAYGFQIPSDSIPSQVQCGQVAAAAEYGAGTDVRSTNDGKNIASEEVTGAVKVSYFDNGKTGSSVQITKALDCLQPLMIKSSGLYSFNVCRG